MSAARSRQRRGWSSCARVGKLLAKMTGKNDEGADALRTWSIVCIRRELGSTLVLKLLPAWVAASSAQWPGDGYLPPPGSYWPAGLVVAPLVRTSNKWG